MKSNCRDVSKYLEESQEIKKRTNYSPYDMSIEEMQQLFSMSNTARGFDKARLSWNSFNFGFAAGYRCAQKEQKRA